MRIQKIKKHLLFDILKTSISVNSKILDLTKPFLCKNPNTQIVSKSTIQYGGPAGI